MKHSFRSDSGVYFKHLLGSLKFSIKQFVIPVKEELVVFKFCVNWPSVVHVQSCNQLKF